MTEERVKIDFGVLREVFSLRGLCWEETGDAL